MAPMGVQDPVRSTVFRLLTPATPDAVWGWLTCPERSPQYLHGLSVRTTWEPGAPVHLTSATCGTLPGQVLRVEPPVRLSLTVEDACGTCTYLTWTLRDSAADTVLRLQVEECGGATTDEELEDVWLPVLDRLRDLLVEAPGAG